MADCDMKGQFGACVSKICLQQVAVIYVIISPLLRGVQAEIMFINGPVAQWLAQATHKLIHPNWVTANYRTLGLLQAVSIPHMGAFERRSNFHYCKSTATGVIISSIFSAASSCEWVMGCP